MRFHDYHLRGYEETDFGQTVCLDLVFDYPTQTKDESHIEFAGVVCYHFIHTAGAILTDIEEWPVGELAEQEGDFLKVAAIQQSVRFWKDGLPGFISMLESEKFKAWRLESAVGFAGFVIARSAAQKPNQALDPTRKARGSS